MYTFKYFYASTSSLQAIFSFNLIFPWKCQEAISLISLFNCSNVFLIQSERNCHENVFNKRAFESAILIHFQFCFSISFSSNAPDSIYAWSHFLFIWIQFIAWYEFESILKVCWIVVNDLFYLFQAYSLWLWPSLLDNFHLQAFKALIECKQISRHINFKFDIIALCFKKPNMKSIRHGSITAFSSHSLWLWPHQPALN